MSNSWFRMYHEFSTDPKIQMLSEVNQRRYVMILCLRCSNDHVTLHDVAVAFQLRISNDEWLDTKKVLMSENLINDSNQPIAWEKRQYISDSSTARVRAHREKAKTSVKQPCNVTETKCNALDTDTDTDTEKKKIKKKSPSPLSKIKSDFQPTENSYKLLLDKQIPKDFIDSQVLEFIAYWTETGEKKKSWDSTFRNRVKFEYEKNKNQPTGFQSFAED